MTSSPKQDVAVTVWHRLEAILSRLRPYRGPVSLVLDGTMIALAWNMTYLFRLGFERWFAARPSYDFWVMLCVIAVYLGFFALVRVPQSMWRFSGFGEIKRLTLACLCAGVLSALVAMGLRLVGVPRSVLALHPLVSLMFVCAERVGYRMFYEHTRAQINKLHRGVRRALVLGAGEAARRLVAGIHHQGWIVTGLLDDDRDKQGARIAGVPVLGPLAAVRDPDIRGSATHVIIALPAATVAERRRAFELASESMLQVLTIPSADELLTHSAPVEALRDIEPEDLLGRDPVQLDEAGIGDILRDKTVLITGAGGSIGSELCAQVARYEPRRLVLVELSEFNLYSIEQSLSRSFPELELVRLIGDVKDLQALQRIMRKWQPQVVFHAAAYKHVPLMEENNSAHAVRNNTLGTYHAALAAAEVGVERFVLISTDKAVNPTNVMGATKRAAEMVISALVAEYPKTRFMAVRFGNVLGSSGSVIPKFKDQIARGGPVTVTHPDIIRYFMTIPEAARLVLQAGAIGESGQVLVLDMGEPVKIVDLARDMIRLSGRSVDDIAIEFTGLRPGEKLYEELLADADATISTPFPQLRIARLESRQHPVAGLLRRAASTEELSDAAVREELARVVPEYRPAP